MGQNLYKKFDKIIKMLPKSQEVQLGPKSPAKNLLEVNNPSNSSNGN